MELIDTHCHLTALKHVSPRDALKSAAASFVTRVICVGSVEDTRSAFAALELVQQFANVWASVGIHPHDAGSFTSVEKLEELAAHPRVVAIGETGLDYYRDWSPRENQKLLFINTIALAKACGKPLIIHCRDALEETIALLIAHKAGEIGGVFHCYAGNAQFAERLRGINFLVSFPGSLTFRNAHTVREAAAAIPLDQIMLETDCPYMAPEPFRGKPSEPAHVLNIAQKLAELRGTTLDDVAAQTTANAVSLFRLPAS